MPDHGNPLTSRDRESGGLCPRCLLPVALVGPRCPSCGFLRPGDGWIPMEGPAELELPQAHPASGGDGGDLEDAGPMEESFSPIVLELPRAGHHHNFEPPLDAGAAEVLDELEMPDLDADDYDDSSDPTGLSVQEGAPLPGRLRVRVVPAAIEQLDEPGVVIAPQARPVDLVPPSLAPQRQGAALEALFAGRYRLAEEQPARGACRTFLAVQEPMVRRVVVGVLQDLGGGELQQAVEARFLRDAALLSRRGHPNLAALHDFGRAPDGRCFLVGELLYGLTLREVLDRGPLHEERIAPLFLDLCRGLAACHEVGLAHRGVVAENVTLESGAGLAPADSLARLGMVGLGVVPEALGDGVAPVPGVAPEVLEGREAGPSADVYALGLLLWEALIGVDETGALEALKRSGGRRGSLAGLALRCLQVEPEARPTVEAHLIPALSALVGRATRAAAVPVRLGWRMLLAAALAGALVPSLLLVAGGAWWLIRPAPEPDLAPLRIVEVVPAVPLPPPVEPIAAEPAGDALALAELEPAPDDADDASGDVTSEPEPAAPTPKPSARREPPPRPRSASAAAAVPEVERGRAGGDGARTPGPDVQAAAAQASGDAEIEATPAFATRPVVIATAPDPTPVLPPVAPAPSPHRAAAVLDGLWLGTAGGRDLALDLKVSPEGQISGSARLRRGAEVESGHVRGRVSELDGIWLVELQLVEEGEATSYSGRFEDGGMQGRVTQGGRARGRWRVAR